MGGMERRRPVLTYALGVRPTGVRIRLLSFGPWRALLAASGEMRELDAGSAVGDLLRVLEGEDRFPAGALRTAAVAVNQMYARPEQGLQDGDEVAILPPVSGGAVETVRLTHEVIASEAVLAEFKSGDDGALCIFDGVVRNNTRGRRTLHLDYEAYEEMALRQMQDLRLEALGRFAVREIAIVHRLGRLLVGETSVYIAVASAHRGAAFEACRWVIDTLKKKVPIWKQEHFVDGVVWPDGEPFPEDLTGPGL